MTKRYTGPAHASSVLADIGVRGSEFVSSQAMCTSSQECRSSESIPDVFSVGSSLEVAWSNAGQIFTKMADFEPFREIAIGETVNVSEHRVACWASLTTPEDAIACRQFGSSPEPTTSKLSMILGDRPVLIDFGPEPFFGSLACINAGHATSSQDYIPAGSWTNSRYVRQGVIPT